MDIFSTFRNASKKDWQHAWYRIRRSAVFIFIMAFVLKLLEIVADAGTFACLQEEKTWIELIAWVVAVSGGSAALLGYDKLRRGVAEYGTK